MDASPSIPTAPDTRRARLRRRLSERIADALETLRDWPWFETLRTLRLRFREDQLGLTAGGLTFTTLIAIVPLLTVALALFTAFPMFSNFQGALEKYFLQSLVPDSIAKPVLSTLTQFANKAHRLGAAGLIVLLASALMMMLTIDRALNGIWRVRKPRPIAQRVLVYWATATLGPLLLGISLSLTSYVLSVSRGFVTTLPGGVTLLLDAIEYLVLAASMASLFHYVPNTGVRWRHAWAGGLFVAAGFEFAKRALAWYVGSMSSFSTIYGAFATVPIFLLWIYLGWVIVLLGAVIAAYAPSLKLRVVRQADAPGQQFALSLSVLDQLAKARASTERGLEMEEISAALRVETLQIEPVVDALIERDWVARLDEEDGPRYVLLCDPRQTPVGTLIDDLLLRPGGDAEPFRRSAGIDRMMLADLLGPR